MPYHRLRNPEKYIAQTFLGNRTAVHHASYGCPFRCKFCGVTEVAHGRQKSESPERTANVLAHIQREYSIDSVQFYDNNFFLREDDVADLARRITPLNLSWWCEGRIDILLRYSDATLHALRRSGCKMIFLGAESGSDKILREMDKQLTSAQTLELAGRIRQFGIIPEFSFVIGNPQEPEQDLKTNMQFIRRLKSINPEAEIIVQHYTPTPHPDGMYGDIDGKIVFPKTPEEWASPRWYNFTVRQDPALPWLPRKTKRLIDAFETVLACRWPTIQDSRISRWARDCAASSELVAVQAGRVRVAFRTRSGAEDSTPAQSQSRERMTVLAPREAYRTPRGRLRFEPQRADRLGTAHHDAAAARRILKDARSSTSRPGPGDGRFIAASEAPARSPWISASRCARPSKPIATRACRCRMPRPMSPSARSPWAMLPNVSPSWRGSRGPAACSWSAMFTPRH